MANVAAASAAGDELEKIHGLVPVVPHWRVMAQLTHPTDYETVMAWCLSQVERCDALLRLPGHSPGSDREVAHAKEHGLEVFDGLSDLRARIGALL